MSIDIEIAQAAVLKPIAEVAAQADIPSDALIPHGRHLAKLDMAYLEQLRARKPGKLILVTAITPRRRARARPPPPSGSATP
jgi:formate--tetrahydrofolate ligase